MTPEQVLMDIQDQASEWLEMEENPAELLAGILAHKVVALNHQIHFLERMLEHERSSHSR